MTGPLLTTGDVWILLAVAVVSLVAWLLFEVAVAQPAPPDIPCRRCDGHGWVVSPGWARVPYATCSRCAGTGVE